MTMTKVEIDVPEEIVPYTVLEDKEAQITRNAMLGSIEEIKRCDCMIVISDTTPIISLMKAGQLELLQKLFGTVYIPKAVYQELTENEAFSEEVRMF